MLVLPVFFVCTFVPSNMFNAPVRVTLEVRLL